MRLTSIEIHPDKSSVVAILSFRDPSANNPYNVKGITGLDADEIVPRSYGGSGSFRFYNLSLPKRDVVFKIGLNPRFSDGKSYSELRDDLYKMISSSRTGKIVVDFKNRNDVKASVSGFVSKFTNPIFDKDPTVEITVKCDEPLLRAPEAVVISDLDPAHALISDDESTAPHGFSFSTVITGVISSLKMSNPEDTTWSFEVIPSDGFLIGDKLVFSSEFNAKELYLVRSSVNIYLGDVIVPGSVWPIIFPGDNPFVFNHPGSLDWHEITYHPTYWGV